MRSFSPVVPRFPLIDDRGLVVQMLLRAVGIALLVSAASVGVAHAQQLTWVTPAGGADNDDGWSVAADASGDSYVTGRFRAIATFGRGEVRETTLAAFGSFDVFVAKYSRQGELMWVSQAGAMSGTGFETAWGLGIAVDNAGRPGRQDSPVRTIQVCGLDRHGRGWRRTTRASDRIRHRDRGGTFRLSSIDCAGRTAGEVTEGRPVRTDRLRSRFGAVVHQRHEAGARACLGDTCALVVRVRDDRARTARF